jgi:O-antigen/teichoic acid export membrane protein
MSSTQISLNESHGSPFVGHMLLTTGTNLLLALSGLVTGTLAARILGPQGRGELAAIQTWPTFIAAIAMLGLPEALVYYCAREPGRAGRYLGSAVSLAVMASSLFMAAGYLAMPIVLSTQLPETIAAARWYLLLVPLYALVGMLFHPLRGRNDLIVWNIVRVTPTMGWLAVLLFAGLTGRASPQFIAAGYLVVLAITFLPVSYAVSRRVPGSFSPDVSKWADMLRYGLASLLSSAPRVLNLRLDQMLMAGLLPAHALGLYVVAVAWSGAVQPMLGALGAVLFPRVASQANPMRQNSLFAQGSRMGIVLSAATAVALMVFTPWAVPALFGVDFSAAIPAALILTVAGAIAGANLVLEEGIRGLGRPLAVMRAELAGLIVTAASLIPLLRSFEIAGAAMATLLGSGAVAVVLVAQARRLTRSSLADLLCPSFKEVQSGWRRMKRLIEVTK